MAFSGRWSSGAGGLWGVALSLLFMWQLPCLAYWSARPHPAGLGFPVLQTLAAVHGLRTSPPSTRDVLLAGNSTSAEIPPRVFAPAGAGHNAYLMGGNVFSTTAFARYLIDRTKAAVVIVPLSWQTFPSYRGAAATLPPEWVPNPQDDHLATYGFGGPAGIFIRTRRFTLEWLHWHHILLPIADSRAMRVTDQWLAYTPAHPLDTPPTYRREAYYAWVRALPSTKVRPSPQSLQRLRALQRYAESRGVTVLYYLTPHNPAYLDAFQLREGFARFRGTLRSYLWLDLGDAVPARFFRGDLHHLLSEGSTIVAQHLRAGLADQRQPGDA